MNQNPLFLFLRNRIEENGNMTKLFTDPDYYGLLEEVDWVKWFAQFVLDKKLLKGWKIKFLDFEDTSSCDNERKIIEISGLGSQPRYYLKEIILHEISHALDPDSDLGKTSVYSHDSAFFKRYGKLLIEFSEFEPNNKGIYKNG